MAYTVYSTSNKAKSNMNGLIETSAHEVQKQGFAVQEVTLDKIQSAIDKLSTYIKQVDNCGNCFNVTMCQTSTCQSYTCQTCQASTCQTCQKYSDYYDYYSYGDSGD